MTTMCEDKVPSIYVSDEYGAVDLSAIEAIIYNGFSKENITPKRTWKNLFPRAEWKHCFSFTIQYNNRKCTFFRYITTYEEEIQQEVKESEEKSIKEIMREVSRAWQNHKKQVEA